MATEIELKLALPAAAAHRLSAHPLLGGRPGHRQRLENVYHDTPELDLLAALVAVRWRKKGGRWLFTVKSAEPASGGLARRSEWERPALPGETDFSLVDDAALRERLEAVASRLEPVFATHFTRTTWNVEHQGALVELALDRGWIESAGRREPICEVEIELISGDLCGLFALARALQQDLPLHPMVASKAERGYALHAGKSAKPFKARPTLPTPEASAIAAFKDIALGCLEQLQRNEAGIAAGTDPEYLHQSRIALRRLRASLGHFAAILPPAFVARYAAAWRELAHDLNPARNWDVFVTQTLPPLRAALSDDPAALRLLQRAARQAGLARRHARTRFSGRDFSRLLLEFTGEVVALPEAPEPTFADIAAALLEKHGRSTRKAARKLDASDVDACHALRIRIKKLRYALESLPGSRRRKRDIAWLARLQERLGEICDCATGLQLLDLIDTGRSGYAHGWLAGRQALLAARLTPQLGRWLKREPPWKHA